MRFYTNVQMVGDNFLVRGYEDGRHFATREKFYPTLFVDTKKKSKYKTLTGEPVEAIEPGTVRETSELDIGTTFWFDLPLEQSDREELVTQTIKNNYKSF